jgi:hypothetical protein
MKQWGDMSQVFSRVFFYDLTREPLQYLVRSLF